MTFPALADDTAYLNRPVARLLNSRVAFAPNSASFSRQYGFVFPPKAAHTEVTTESTYTARTHSKGFRTRELQPRPGNEYRTGLGVEEPDMVSSVMERLDHSSAPTPHLSVCHYSVSGHKTVQELLVANADWVLPDHLVLGFFIGNDVLPNAIASVDRHSNYSPSHETESRVRRELRRRLGVLFYSLILREGALRAYVPRLRYWIARRDHVIARSYALLTELKHKEGNSSHPGSTLIILPSCSPCT